MSQFVTSTSHKSRKTALIVYLIGGTMRLHYLYVGRYGKWILYMLTAGFFVFGWIIDIFKILLGRFQDQYGNYLAEW